MAGADDRQMEVAFGKRLLEDGRGSRLELVAVDVDASVGSLEGAAAWTAVEHLDAVRVEEALPRVAILRLLDLGRPTLVHAQGPLRDVEMMRAHVGQHAAGVLTVETPL